MSSTDMQGFPPSGMPVLSDRTDTTYLPGALSTIDPSGNIVIKPVLTNAAFGALRVSGGMNRIEFDDVNGWIARTAGTNTMTFSPSGNATAHSMTSSILNISIAGGVAGNISFLAAATGGAQGTATIEAIARGGNTGTGHIMEVKSGNGSTASTGAPSGDLKFTVGNAGGSGNNKSGDILANGGTPTGSGAAGKFKIGSVLATDLEVTGAITASTRINDPSYTVGTLPAAGVAGGNIYVSDAAVAPCHAFSNGTNWKRCDNAATTVV